MNYEIKDTEKGVTSVVDVDDKSRRVKVVISRMGNLDLDNDVIDPSAYNKTIKERGPQGAGLIWHLTDHTPRIKDSAIARFSELFKDGDKLVGVTDIPNTSHGNDMLEFYKTGNINQHSVGFRTIKEEPVNAGKPGEHRLIKEILLYEGSAVLWGANPLTETVSVGKSLSKEEREKNFFDALKELTNLHKLFKSGTLTDGSFEMLEIQLAQKADILKQLFDLHTQPADNAVEPIKGEDLLSVFKTFNNSLITANNDSRTITGTA